MAYILVWEINNKNIKNVQCVTCNKYYGEIKKK